MRRQQLPPNVLPVDLHLTPHLGQILERGPGSQDQWLHRDDGVWADVPKPSPELQLASVIALVDFNRDNGAT